jgi:hypothetical protein
MAHGISFYICPECIFVLTYSVYLHIAVKTHIENKYFYRAIFPGGSIQTIFAP